MSIASEIARIKGNIAAAYAAAADKGATLPDVQNSANLPATIQGIPSGTDTSDATATAGDILSGKTAYIASGKATGNIASKAAAAYTPGTQNQTIAAGQYLAGAQTIKGDANLLAENIKKGVTIFGVTGTMEAETMPTGSIIQMMGKTAPDGYLACDGTVYNIADYAALAAYFAAQFDASNYFGGDGTTTFAVPDLRGEFLRGAGTNGHANQGGGAAVGTHQDATHIPLLSTYYNSSNSAITASVYASDGTSGTANNKNEPKSQETWILSKSGTNKLATFKADSLSSAVNTGYQGDSYSSRPTNTSVLYCIKT